MFFLKRSLRLFQLVIGLEVNSYNGQFCLFNMLYLVGFKSLIYLFQNFKIFRAKRCELFRWLNTVMVRFPLTTFRNVNRKRNLRVFLVWRIEVILSYAKRFLKKLGRSRFFLYQYPNSNNTSLTSLLSTLNIVRTQYLYFILQFIWLRVVPTFYVLPNTWKWF